MKNTMELQRELAQMEAEKNRLDNLSSKILQTREAITDIEATEAKVKQKAIKDEAEKLKKQALIETDFFTKCPLCKKTVKLSNVKSTFWKGNPNHVILEGICPNCKFQTNYEQNNSLTHPILYCVLKETKSAFKQATLGYG